MTKLYKLHQKRIKLVIFGVVFLLSLTTSKTLYIQLFKNETVYLQKDIKTKGSRGIIFDRNGIKLAYDVVYYDLYFL